jgi:recombinational DNA repair ATPase RecF
MESRSLVLESIFLDSYKNYSHSEFSLSQKNLIIGSNGTGKTHILQAIYDMCLGRFSDNFF